jgi:hypothetical protein
VSETATAARRGYRLFAGDAYDPSAAGGRVVWQRPGGVALMQRGAASDGLPGTHPALGGGRIAWVEGATIVTADAGTLRGRRRQAAPGAGALAVSDALLAWRTRDAVGTDRIWVLSAGAEPRPVLEVPPPDELGRPALIGDRLLCHVAGPGGSRLIAVAIATGAQQLLRTEPGAQLSNPSTDGTRMLYVHATGRAQELRIGPIAPADPGDDDVVLVHPSSGRRDREHEHGRKRHRHRHRGQRPKLPPLASPGVVDTLWTTALTPDAAYVTRIRARKGQERRADILRVHAVARG